METFMILNKDLFDIQNDMMNFIIFSLVVYITKKYNNQRFIYI